nr:MAG TPA: hypothetical protein [Caudoviricetes sp.]
MYVPDYVEMLIYVNGIEASMPPSASRSNTPPRLYRSTLLDKWSRRNCTA